MVLIKVSLQRGSKSVAEINSLIGILAEISFMSLLVLLLLLALDTARVTKYISVIGGRWIIGFLTVLAQPGVSFP